MRLFLYYALHSFKNQLKKLFKTWVLVFIVVCALIGGVIGFGASRIADLSDAQQEQTDVAETPEAPTEPDAPEEPGALEAMGLEKADVVELAAGLIILAIFAIEALFADKNGSRLFLPADVNLLFSAPMLPQSVLMFRLTTQLGTALAASIYLLFQLPNLTLNLGLSLWAALAVILTWAMTIMVGKLLQVLLYLFCSNHPGARDWVRRGTYALLALIAVGFVVYWRGGELPPLAAAVRFFNAPGTRWIPLWGWLKGFLMFAVEGNALLTLACLLLTGAGGAALVLVIRGTKADFYEDAMAKSEETAALMERQRSERSTGLVSGGKRKKDRSERLRRDGFSRGRGANVFFFKTLYNRARFAHLGFFTKTSEVYLAAAVAVAALERFAIGTRVFLPVAAVITAVAFFRALGNPLEQDTKSDYFLLIPESTWAKLFWSLLGGTVTCLLDFLPGLVVGALILGADAAEVLCWVPLILAMDFYATSVGAFINLSVPVSAGKNIKQFVQILFIYFGLLPSVAVIAVCAVTDRTLLGVLLSALLNLILGGLFFALTPLFLDPGARGADIAAADGVDTRTARRRFSRMGLAAVVLAAGGSVLQALISALVQAVKPGLLEDPTWMYVVGFLPLYIIAYPLALLVLRRVPKAAPRAGEALSAGRALSLIPICVFLTYAGNFVAVGLNALLSRLLGTGGGNVVEALLGQGSLAMQLLFVVVLGPVMEEVFFRRALIDRMRPYGERLAVVTSALAFALVHGNLSQFFYAFLMGLLLGWIYLRTGKLRWSMGLHILTNLCSGVLPTLLQKKAGLDALEGLDLGALARDPGALAELANPWLVALGGYLIVMGLLFLAGLVLLVIRARSVRFERAELELPRSGRVKIVWCNVGMALLVVFGVVSAALTLAVM